jgi:hypothetical protein
MISVFASSVVDHGFEPLSGETKYYKIGMCGFSAKHATLKIKAMTRCVEIRILRPNGATCLYAAYVSVS